MDKLPMRKSAHSSVAPPNRVHEVGRQALGRGDCSSPAIIYLLATILLTLSSLSLAQTLTFGTSLGFTEDGLAPEPSLVLSDVDYQDVDFSFRIAGVAVGPLELGVRARGGLSYGPIGAIELGGRADVDTSGAFRTTLQGSGVITSVAARAQLRFFNVDPGRFELSDAYLLESPPRYGSDNFGVTLDLGGSYRLNRTTIIELDPGLRFLAQQGFGAHMKASVQFRRLIGRDDGVLLLLADLAPSAEAGYVATGFEYRLNRRELPVLRGSLWLGMGSGGVYPGLRLELNEAPRGNEPGFGLELAAEPYRYDVLSFRSRAFVSGNIGSGLLLFEALIGYDPSEKLPPFALGLQYETSF